MTPAEDRVVAGLREAILTEEYGVQFYNVAAANTRDEQGREVFAQLGREEELHRQWLVRQYGRARAGQEFEPLSAPHAELVGPNPIFSDKLKQRIGEAHWEMTALAVGLTLEQATIERYRAMALASTSQAARSFFDELVVWEESHADALRRQHNSLLESYWNEARFAPF